MPTNSDLTVSEVIQPGDDRTINFIVTKTVPTLFIALDKISGSRLRQHQKLWQNGELKYKVHFANGADIKPGVYNMTSDSYLTSYTIENVLVPAEMNQTLEFEISLGQLNINYQFHEEPTTSDRRCWIQKVDDDGHIARKRGPAQLCNGDSISINEGNYYVKSWQTLGGFEDAYFDVVSGQTTNVHLLQKK